MAKLVNYTCVECGENVEEIYNDTEEQLDELEDPCPKCGGTMKKNNMKDNCHRWCYADRNGV